MSQRGGQRGGGAKGNNGKQPSMQRGGKGLKINQGQGKPPGNQAKKQGVPRGPNTNQHLGGPRLPNPIQFQEQSCGSQQRFPRGPHPNHFQGQPHGNQEGCQRIPNLNQCQGQPCGMQQGGPRGPNPNQFLRQPQGNQQGGPRGSNPNQFLRQPQGNQQGGPQRPNPNQFPGQPQGNQQGGPNWCTGQPQGKQGGQRGPNPNQFPGQPQGNQQGGPHRPNPNQFSGQPQGNQQRGPNPNLFSGQPQGNQQRGPRRQNQNQCPAQPQGNQQGGPRRPNPNQFPGQHQGNQQGGPHKPNPNQFPGQSQGNQQGGPRRSNSNMCPGQHQGKQQGGPKRPIPNQFPGQPQGNQQGDAQRPIPNQFLQQPQGNQSGGSNGKCQEGPQRPVQNQGEPKPKKQRCPTKSGRKHPNMQKSINEPTQNPFQSKFQGNQSKMNQFPGLMQQLCNFTTQQTLPKCHIQQSKKVQPQVQVKYVYLPVPVTQLTQNPPPQESQPQVLLSGPVSQTGINIQKGDGQQDRDNNRSKASLRRQLRRVHSRGDGKDKVGQQVHQHDNEEQNGKIPDVDDTEVFKFLIKTFGGGCSYEDFLRRCDLFPLNSNIMLWFRKHNRRFHIFWDKKDIVYLQPFYRDAKICVQWNSKKNPGECQNAHWDYFHICRRFIRGNCKDKDCPLSHSFRSPHNYRLKNKLGIGNFSDDEMRIVLNCNSPSVCADYIYNNGCKVDNPERRCPHLHICRQKIFGKCSDPCKFNRTHTINQFHNKWVLTSCHMKGWPPAKVFMAIYVPPREKKENDNYSDDSDLSQNEDDLHDIEESSVFDYDSDVYVSSESLSSSALGPAKNKIVHSVENLSINYNKEGTRSKHGRKERFRSLENITCGIVGKDDQDLTESSDDYDDKDDYGGGNVDDDDDYGDSKVDKDHFCDGNVDDDDDDDDYGDGNDDGDDDDYSDGNDEDYYGDRNVENDPRVKEMIMTENQNQVQQGNGNDNALDDGCDFGNNDDYQDNYDENYVNDYHENDGNDYHDNDGNDYDDNEGGDYYHDYGDYDYQNDAEDDDNELVDDNDPRGYDDGHGDDNKRIEKEKLTIENIEQDQQDCEDDNIKKSQQERNEDVDSIKEKEEEMMENWKVEKQDNDKNSKDEHQNLLDDDDIKEKERIQMEKWKKEQQQNHDDDDNIIERERLMMEQWKQQQQGRSVLPNHTDVKSEPAPSPSDPEYQETDLSLLKDETENTKICVFVSKDKCTSASCKKHHLPCGLPYLWQIKISGKWFSFSLAENEKIEKSFCDLQDVAPTEMKCEDNKYNCHIWFQKMHAVILDVNGLPAADDDQWSTVRRLSTPSFAEKKMTVDSYLTQWRWYWKDDDEWTMFNKDLFLFTLERKYQTKQKSYLFSKENNFLMYKIEFMKMIQINLETDKVREIIRRPLLVSKDDVLQEKFLDSIPFPSAMGTPKPAHFYNWDCSHEFEPIELDEAGKEYTDVLKSILDSMDPSKFDFKFIYRIQNRKIWSEYDIKKKHMLTDAEQDGQGQNIDERDLFHGTDSLDTCHGICTNNFDFRTSGRNATVYGEGSYFAVRARLSHSYTKADSPTDMRFLFRAKVLVGKFTEGNPSLRRPPEIPGQVHKLYDSCVDKVEDPQIFVVFDRNQCYPEYIIMYTDKEPVKVEKPMVQPLVNQPLVQPLVSQPLVQPLVNQPLVQPLVSQPLVQPLVNQPLVQPLVSQPLVQPLVYQPIVYPHCTESPASLPMHMGGPIVYPHPVDRSATPTMQSSIEKPASREENSSAHLNKHCKKEKDECVLQ
ncbi:uncharacterized protein LOC127720278 isoform X2 [Mytilus californianus]|uniref:uncharacterized protein LOC127720278 isoform X2 n=1 Tax=Mytilus californianus TaxID=6549 RepID=UPI0022483EF4|nr:uncharacterized protein LOC127720278 isoform X2 [Mytilus californianus]